MGLKWLLPVVFAFNFVYNKLGQRLQPGLVGVQHAENQENLQLVEATDADEIMTFLPLFLGPDADELESNVRNFTTPIFKANVEAVEGTQVKTKDDTQASGSNYLVISIVGLGFLMAWFYLSSKQ